VGRVNIVDPALHAAKDFSAPQKLIRCLGGGRDTVDFFGSFYANFFTVGSLVPMVFHGFLAIIFLSIPNKSKSTFHMGLLSTLFLFFNAGYFIASSFYHPLAAYHRWITVGTILLCETHANMFLYYFHEERHPRLGKVLLYLQYLISIIVTIVFYVSTYGAEKVFLVNAHQWDFLADNISRMVGIVIQFFLAIFAIIMAWKMATIKTRERWVVLLLSLSYIVATLVPSIANTMSRSGLLGRDAFQVLLNIFTVIGFTFMAILALNYTRDRTFVVVKIIGVSLVAILMLFQGFSFFLYLEQEGSFDRLYAVFAQVAAADGEQPVASAYRARLDIDRKTVSVDHDESLGWQFGRSIDPDVILNTALHVQIERLPDADFQRGLSRLLDASHRSFAGYRDSIRTYAGGLGDTACTRQGLFAYTANLQQELRRERNAIANIPSIDYRRSLLAYLQSSSRAGFVPFRNVLLGHLASSESEGSRLKEETLAYFSPFAPQGVRHYRTAAQHDFLTFHYVDMARRLAFEVGYPYLAYRERMHPAAMRFVYILFVVVVIVALGFPLFFRGILIKPLARLVQGLERVERGDYHIQLPVQMKDEIGYVTENFNRMTGTVREAKMRLDNYTQTLEDTVKSRTAELEVANETMRRSEEQFRDIIERATEGIHVANRNGDIQYMNPPGLKKLGYTLDEIVGKNYLELVREDFRDTAALFYLDQMRNRTEDTYLECPVVRKDGVNIWIGMSVKMFTEKQGDIGFYCIARDITEQKKMEDALRESEERYRTLVENASDVIYHCDWRGYFTYFSPYAFRLSGYQPEEILDHHFTSIIHADYRKQMLEFYVQQFRDRVPETYAELPMIKKDGSVFWVGQRVKIVTGSDGKVEFYGIARDVTELKNTENALRASEEKYRTILETNKAGFFEVDLAGSIISCNDVVVSFTKYPREQLIGMSFTKLMSPATADRVFEVYHTVYAREVKVGFVDHEIINSAGEIGFIETTVTLITDEHDAPTGFRALAVDVTARTNAEAALRASEVKYRGILSTIKEGYYELDLKGNFTFINDSMCEIWGRTSEEMIGLNYREYMDERGKDIARDAFRAIYESRERGTLVDFVIYRKNGDERLLETSLGVLIDSTDAIVGFSGMVRDVTERKKVEDALRVSEQKYRSILENIEDAYYEVNLDGIVIFINDAMCRFMNCPADEICGKSYRAFTDDESATRIFDIFNSVFMTGAPSESFDYPIIRKGGERLFTESRASLITDARGRAVGFRGILRDITARKRVAEELQAAKEAAEAANQAKSRFLANMSHELRTPLNAINGIIDLLRFGSFERDEDILASLERMAGRLDLLPADERGEFATFLRDELHSLIDHVTDDGNYKRFVFRRIRSQMLSMSPEPDAELAAILDAIESHVDAEEKEVFASYRRIKESGEYLLGLIDTVLNLAKIESGKIEIKKAAVVVREMVDSVLTNARSYAKSKGKEYVRIICTVRDSVPEIAIIDSLKTRQVLLNMFSNAIKFTPRGDVSLHVELDGDRIVFKVSDSGIGIRDEDRGRIFVEFERTESARNIEGTGLGLAISKRLVELQGGEVGFESEYGKGSTFWFSLPVGG